jgi:citrate synthase
MSTLTARQTAERLGVKLETVYAYVSRGVLSSTRDKQRGSLFDVTEVEALARRGRPRRASRPSIYEVEISTHLASTDGHVLRYRGRDATQLAVTATFEQVADLLWTGSLPDHHEPWTSTPVALPAVGSVTDQIRIAVPLAGALDPLRADLRPESVAACGRSLIATVVDALPVANDGRCPRLVLPTTDMPVRSTIAGRLWARLVPGRARPDVLVALNAALVLLVDHELAASTFAARVAACTRADPYGIVQAGLGPLSGPLHGGRSRAVRTALETAALPGGPSVAVAEMLRTYGHYPGFGHILYPDGDPRAVALLGLLRTALGGSPQVATADALASAVRRRANTHPTIDFALAALGHATGMPPDAGEAIFTIARMAGWIAHALEEYQEPPLRFRPRSRYLPDD